MTTFFDGRYTRNMMMGTYEASALPETSWERAGPHGNRQVLRIPQVVRATTRTDFGRIWQGSS